MTAADTIVPIDLEGLPTRSLPEWLETMVLIREFESVLDDLSLGGKVVGGVHCAIGQEAVAVGTSRALTDDDIITTAHRPHHHALAKGMSPDAAMAELFGKATGCVGGRGGTMHLADFEHGYFPGNGIVGANVGLAMGVALSLHMRGVPAVACALFGDGAANTGRTWEAINLAVVWKLPLVAVCENNMYAVETRIDRVTGGDSIATRAAGFGLPSAQVDGQDAGAVFRAVREARARALAGEGPTFIEALTYRYLGHSTGAEPAYRSDEEVNAWRSTRDPIDRLRAALTAADLIDNDQYEQGVARCRQVVANAVAAAEAAAEPEPASAAAGVTGFVVTLPKNLHE